MEEALGADGHGFLEQHDALIGLVAEELQGSETAWRRHVEMLSAARGYDKALCCGHVGLLPGGGMRINADAANINVTKGVSSSLSNAVASARRRAVSLLAREQSAGELAKGLKALFDPRMPGRAAAHSQTVGVAVTCRKHIARHEADPLLQRRLEEFAARKGLR